ncbi:hypothetical protein [Candidatus Neptunochlamydia vexilliferae]|uniref:Uncharacterized protein n=1 Tax=Candidatus Neptunichlamydia vexilliferae TaxID=1651774 RepID=A0ABS0B1I3_9BACT|nr:hypothetical protein [Candidatus Neptunochlamydia vexilliferae]MBF5060039.1 hypothetical protein [Candidatus Neptunochlamydia vexilliferae]
MGAVSDADGMCILYTEEEWHSYSDIDFKPVEGALRSPEAVHAIINIMREEINGLQALNAEMQKTIGKINRLNCGLVLAFTCETTPRMKRVQESMQKRIAFLKNDAPEGDLKNQAIKTAEQGIQLLNANLKLLNQYQQAAQSHGAYILS